MKRPINNITDHDLAAFGASGSLDTYQSVATKTAIYPGQGTALGLAYCALKLNGEAGEIAEHVGKAMRDDGLVSEAMRIKNDHETEDCFIANELGFGRKNLLIKEVGDVLWYLSAMCNELGIKLSEAAAVNLNKLKDRTDRDVLQGSGDER